jgi:hypothetical protein
VTFFSYDGEQQAALLGALGPGAGVKAVEIVAAVTRAGRAAIATQAEHRSASQARDVIPELARLGDQARALAAELGEVKADQDATPARLRTLLWHMRRRQLDIPPDALVADLAALAEAAAAARRELSGDGPFGAAFMIDGVILSRRGRTPNVHVVQLGMDLAFIWRIATGAGPTLAKRKDDGTAYGPFIDFIEAAVRPTGLVAEHHRVDALAAGAKRAFEDWRRAIEDGYGLAAGVTCEDEALPLVAERLGIACRRPRE